MLLGWTIWNNYELFLYSLEQKISLLLFFKITSLTPFIFLLLFCAGLLTSLTPCFISIIPLAFSYLNTNSNLRINKNFFILGLFTNLLFIIISSNFISYNYIFYSTRIPFISFLILLLVSLNLLQVLNLSPFFKFLFFDYNKVVKRNLILNSYITGIIIGFSTLPCSTPLVVLINFWLYHMNELWLSLFCLFVYLLGCILPFFLIFNFFLDYLQVYIIAFLWKIITPSMGFIVLTLSLFFFFEKIFI